MTRWRLPRSYRPEWGPSRAVLLRARRVRDAETALWFAKWVYHSARLAFRPPPLPPGPGPEARDPPSVSVVTVTKRPGCLRWAASNVARLDYPRLEWVLALHGDGFDAAGLDALTARIPQAVTVVVGQGSKTLGECRNAAAAAAGGSCW